MPKRQFQTPEQIVADRRKAQELRRAEDAAFLEVAGRAAGLLASVIVSAGCGYEPEKVIEQAEKYEAWLTEPLEIIKDL
jgi:hypothetical protein